MAKAYDRARTREFIPSCDKDAEGKPVNGYTTFTLGWLSVFDFTSIEEEMATTNGGKGGVPQLIAIVRRALRGWKNFPLPDGTEAPFVRGEDGLPTMDTIRQIGPKEIMEMARDCDIAEKLTTEDVGKS